MEDLVLKSYLQEISKEDPTWSTFDNREYFRCYPSMMSKKRENITFNELMPDFRGTAELYYNFLYEHWVYSKRNHIVTSGLTRFTPTKKSNI
ncbi:hypothetical protein PPL_09656 [Heterostelium album PN500]|uniref:Uncharacterized protein n=1 Tax=Heterostelium pallidum (strain ATCC 26659 / Pp 5 / PN500) TaxID=670386 RepID=D3BNY5_HETP5|nr:hypothetical protein PPL_09656 [Heterostelium album PN500]EFA76904.1 hypothetical protein PPL_09656 [Heterostelium album PN500]|eukprot:XP_020429036.1 hypothetical protein PPL_09656 [Heterostelium album PN500]